MEKNKDPGDNKMPQGWLFMSNYLSLIRRTAAILIFSLSSSLFTAPNIWIIINFDFMEQQHCQRLRDTSYLRRAHALRIALILRLPKNKVKKRKERKSWGWVVSPPSPPSFASEDGLNQQPLPFFTHGKERANGPSACAGLKRGSFNNLAVHLTSKHEAKRCRSVQRDNLWA